MAGADEIAFIGEDRVIDLTITALTDPPTHPTTLSITAVSSGGPIVRKIPGTQSLRVHWAPEDADPDVEGEFGYLVAATDGCTIAMGSFTLNVARYRFYLSMVNLSEVHAPQLTAFPTGDDESYFGDVGYETASGYVEIDDMNVSIDLVTDGGAVAATVAPAFTPEHEARYTLVALDNAGTTVTAFVKDNIDPVDGPDVARGNLFHGADGFAPISVSTPLGPVPFMQDVPYGVLSDSDTILTNVGPLPITLSTGGSEYAGSIAPTEDDVVTYFIYEKAGGLFSLARSFGLDLEDLDVAYETIEVTPQ